MRLYEEYFRRHQIQLPVAHHCAGASCVVRMGDKRIWSNFVSSDEAACRLPAYAIMEIRWMHASSRPGEYSISLKSPLHDASGSSGYFLCPYSRTVKWHEYEDVVAKVCEMLRGAKTFKDPIDRVLAIWEMFVYAHDTWFCRQGGDIKRLLYQSLDKDMSTLQRTSCVSDSIRRISSSSPGVAKAWRDDFLVHLKQDNDWLASLIGGTCENNILQLS